MHLQQRKTLVVFAIAFLTLTAIAAIAWYVYAPQTPVAASRAEQPDSSRQQVSIQPTSPDAGSAPSSKIKDDITVTLIAAKLIDTGIEVDVCFTTLDGGEWIGFYGPLEYGTYAIPPDEAGLIGEQKADANNTGTVCELVRYRIDDLTSVTTPIQFSVVEVRAIPKEMPACEDFFLRFNTNPQAKALGLQAQCVESDQGLPVVTLTGHAPSVAQEQAQTALDRIVQDAIQGPWEFTITDLQK